MKLTEMAKPSDKKINKFMESRFGFSIDFDKLTVKKAKLLGETIDQNLYKLRRSPAFHTAEKNPQYMELITVRENLNRWVKSQLNEGEVANAEVLLAARDMVDSVQDIIERVGKMQNEQLPQLLDSIRDQISPEKADGFKNSVGTTLSTLMTELTTAREGVDKGVRILSGQEVDSPMSLGSTNELPGDDLSLPDSGELPPPDLGDETDGFGASDAATGGNELLGREKR